MFSNKLSLYNYFRVRTASIIARDRLVLGVLDAEDYEEILGHLYEERNNQKVAILKKFEIFRHWSYNRLSSILMHTEEAIFLRNQVIFHEGEKVQKMYFVMDGVVEVKYRVI
jgi:hypothetical protein